MRVSSDEGMWLLNDAPRKLLEEKYQFTLTDAWLEKAMKANVRFNSGGSGGFVSPEGLIVTNHHIAADALQKLSKPGQDLYRDGFYAKSREEELRCPDLELNVLQSIEDVTTQVNAAVKPEMSPADAFAARRAVMGQLEKASQAKTGLRSDVVTLYQGGLYQLYRYKKYTDVRLVFAPEAGIAGFGGDVDNFEYPRYGLDVAFFRVYENDQPVQAKHYFPWSLKSPKPGDLVFVTGHPGTTNRLETLEKLKHRRDVTLPYSLSRLRALEAALSQYRETGLEQSRQASTDLHRVANARKAYSGQYQGLLDPKILEQKREAETELKERYAKLEPKSTSKQSFPWATIANVQQKLVEFEIPYSLLESGHAFSSELFTIARHCVRLADELPKPSSERLREYRDSNLESLKFQLFSPAPLYPALERTKLQTSLTFLAENLGGDHPLVRQILLTENPAGRADRLISETKLMDVNVRKQLVEGGRAAIEASQDPLIMLARTVDAPARELRRRYETEIEEPERQAFAEIAQMRFAVLGRTVAPDATFTLRLAFGVVGGYEVEGQRLPHTTTFGDVFARSEAMSNREPFELPIRWQNGKEKVSLATPFNFVSTADTIGGNSGSPVLNRSGELIGINFDRNRHGLVRNFVYTDVQARHIAVQSAAVIEALRKLYNADTLVEELAGKD